MYKYFLKLIEYSKFVFNRFRVDAFLNGLKWTTGATVVKALLPIVQYVIFARILAPFELGLIAIVLLLIGFVQIFVDAGMMNAVISSKKCNNKVFESFFWFHIFTGFLVTVIFITTSPLVLSFVKSPELKPYVLLIAVQIPILSVSQFLSAVYQKKLLFRSLAAADSISSIIGVLCSIVLVYCKFGILSYIAGLLITNLIFAMILYGNAKSDFKISMHFKIDEIRDYFKFGMYQVIERLLGFFSTNLDKIVISQFFGLSMLGIYNCAYQIMVKPIGIINTSFLRVSFPYFSTIADNSFSLNESFASVMKKITFINFPIYGFMFLYASEIIHLLYGESFIQSISILQILSIIGVVWTVGNPVGAYLLSQGKARLSLFVNIYQFIIVSIALYFGAQFSLNTMLWAYVFVSVVFLLPVDYFLCKFITRMPFKQYIDSILFSGLPALIISGLIYIVHLVNRSANLAIVIMEILLSMVVYIILCLLNLRISQTKKARALESAGIPH